MPYQNYRSIIDTPDVAGGDWISGGTGDDILFGQEGSDYISGGKQPWDFLSSVGGKRSLTIASVLKQQMTEMMTSLEDMLYYMLMTLVMNSEEATATMSFWVTMGRSFAFVYPAMELILGYMAVCG